ncbi:prepilin peptidase [Candidatus Microgenomates bacterium]|nr:prepilin peptidase [Candidatus Microgenomates bacterium]
MGFLLVIFGLCLGSFLNVLIWRLNDEKAPRFWEGRSICPRCRKPLAWYDNIPLVSFVALGRCCRHCRARISWHYPLVELLTVVAFWVIGWQPPLLILGGVFVVIFFSDWIYGVIPDEMIIIGVAVGLIGRIGQIWTGVAAGLVFFAIVAVTRFRGMGLGDVKLAFLMGFLLGWPKVGVAIWLSFVLGGLVAGSLLLLKRRRLSDKIAFGPYLVLGTLFSALWSNYLLGLVTRF